MKKFQIGFFPFMDVSTRGIDDPSRNQILYDPFVPTSIDFSYTWEMKYRKSQFDLNEGLIYFL